VLQKRHRHPWYRAYAQRYQRNLVAFWRYRTPEMLGGQVFAVIVFAVAAAEVAVGLALFISLYRQRNTIAADEIDLMKW
jgi:NADH:ubiquinone oxidoreductase subunit K